MSAQLHRRGYSWAMCELLLSSPWENKLWRQFNSWTSWIICSSYLSDLPLPLCLSQKPKPRVPQSCAGQRKLQHFPFALCALECCLPLQALPGSLLWYISAIRYLDRHKVIYLGEGVDIFMVNFFCWAMPHLHVGPGPPVWGRTCCPCVSQLRKRGSEQEEDIQACRQRRQDISPFSTLSW